jgi:ABC-2 type transport system permease protein
MTADAGRPATVPPALASIPFRSRVYGFGSVFGKTLRDSRRALLAVGGVLGLLLFVVMRAVTAEFDTPQSREEIKALVDAVPPILQGIAGRAVNVETLGGYVQYKYGVFFPLVTGLWSILALSGTLAGETRRGSMEFLAASALDRRRIAIQKVAGHLLVVTLAMAFVAVAVAIGGAAFPVLPGDEIPVVAAVGYALWLGLMALVAGGVAFALAPFLGRGAAAGIAGAIMFGSFILNGYQVAVPELAPFANLGWFGWTTNHLPLAGEFDWASVALLGVVAAVLLVIGIEAFGRRDLGVTTSIPAPALPRSLRGVEGPTGRAASELLPTALSWGIGLGFFGLVLASASDTFVEQMGRSPQFVETLRSVFPGVDFLSPGGFLQLLFIDFGLILAGLAAATLIGAWASDETSGRLEMLLATPLARVRWLVSGARGVLVAIVVFVLLTAAGIALGAASAGGDLATPVVGTLVLGLYAAALAGVGFAVAGLFGAGLAAPVVAIVTIVIWLVDFLAPLLGLPEAIRQLTLSSYMGQPMVGIWDWTGIVACIALALGGVAVGAWGMARRDLA